jgi:hypothetical protein
MALIRSFPVCRGRFFCLIARLYDLHAGLVTGPSCLHEPKEVPAMSLYTREDIFRIVKERMSASSDFSSPTFSAP